MIALQTFDPLAVRAGLHALIIAYSRSAKGRKKLEEAIGLLREQAMAAQVTPLAPKPRITSKQRETLDDGLLYLEAIRDLIDEGRV